MGLVEFLARKHSVECPRPLGRQCKREMDSEDVGEVKWIGLETAKRLHKEEGSRSWFKGSGRQAGLNEGSSLSLFT